MPLEEKAKKLRDYPVDPRLPYTLDAITAAKSLIVTFTNDLIQIYDKGSRTLETPLKQFVKENGGNDTAVKEHFSLIYAAWYNQREDAIYVFGLAKYFVMTYSGSGKFKIEPPFVRDMSNFKGLAKGIDAVLGSLTCIEKVLCNFHADFLFFNCSEKRHRFERWKRILFSRKLVLQAA